MYVIAIKGKDGKVFYVESLKRGVASTTSTKSSAKTFFSIEQLKHEYNECMKRKCLIYAIENDKFPYILKV